MLAKYYRFRGLWVADQTLTYTGGARINLRISPWKLASTGKVDGIVIVDTMGFTSGTISPDAETEGAVHDNTSLLHIGANCNLEVIADQDSTNGNLYLFMEWADEDAANRWPSDASNFNIEQDLGQPVANCRLDTVAEDQSRIVKFSI